MQKPLGRVANRNPMAVRRRCEANFANAQRLITATLKSVQTPETIQS